MQNEIHTHLTHTQKSDHLKNSERCDVTPKEKSVLLKHCMKVHLSKQLSPFCCDACDVGLVDKVADSVHTESKRHKNKEKKKEVQYL